MSDIKVPISEPALLGNELRYVTDCIKSNWVSSKGKYIELFEKSFSEFNGSKHSIAVSNGTTALHLALAALGIKPGDEVLVPNLTFIATSNSVRYCGAKPVLVEIEKDSWNIDANKIEEKITPKTKAIIPVHLYGAPCDMEKIMTIAKKHNLFVVEDCAEAIGAKHKGKKVGTIGDIGCFSFYGNKIITTGEGGICTTDNDKLAEKMRILKDHGMDPNRRYYHPIVGFNHRMTNIQAALGFAQMESIHKFINKRDTILQKYNSLLKGTKGVKLQVQKEGNRNVCWMYSILIKNREKVAKALFEQGYDSRPFFIPLSNMPSDMTNEQFKISEEISNEGINLPTYFNLADKDIEMICKIIKDNC